MPFFQRISFRLFQLNAQPCDLCNDKQVVCSYFSFYLAMKRFLFFFCLSLLLLFLICLFVCYETYVMTRMFFLCLLSVYFLSHILVSLFCCCSHFIARDFKSAFIGILKRLFCSCCPVSSKDHKWYFGCHIFFHIVKYSNEFGKTKCKWKSAQKMPSKCLYFWWALCLRRGKAEGRVMIPKKKKPPDFHLLPNYFQISHLRIKTDDIISGFWETDCGRTIHKRKFASHIMG